jgi:glycosyltransferase involved in cell wall biosynthesis
MRILFLIDNLQAGGKERRLTQLLNGLKSEQDIEFELIVMNSEIHYKEVFDLGIRIHYVIRKTKKDISVFSKLYNLFRYYKPDLVHCWDSMTAVYLVPTCKLLNIKIVNGMVIDTPVRQNILNKNWLRARLTFPFSDRIVGNSNAGLRAYRAPADKSVCIYNGLNLARFDNLKDPLVMFREFFNCTTDNLFIAGMVATFDDRKDYRMLISAAVSILSERENIRFILVGDGSDFQNIKSIIPAALSGKIILTGRRSDVESIVNIFDVGVLLTNAKVHGEGISNSLIEYMALGKPVLATRGGGTDEVVIDEKSGFLIEPGDVDQLTQKINFLSENRSILSKMGNEGREIIKNRFDLKIMTRNYVELYKRLIYQ